MTPPGAKYPFGTPEYWMSIALSLAETAATLQEVPVGALVVVDQKIISTGFNLRETLSDPTIHAEMIALKRASQNLARWRLQDCDLYVTLEPCLMCAGALYQSRIRKVYYGAPDPKGGATGTLYQVHVDNRLNHNFPVFGGVLAEDCAAILRTFFRQRRS